MKDDTLEAYARAIECHFRTHRGREHVLSPQDFALARIWHESGVALAKVLAGIDRAFESVADISSLAFCRKWVEDRADHRGAVSTAKRRRDGSVG